MRRSTLYPLVALAFVSACSRDVSAPLSPRAVRGGTITRLAGAHGQGNPNSQKYHDTGIHPATGRSGSASLEARALLAMDGSTYIEATTGSLEAGTHSGSIAKAQLKAGGTTQNFNGLSNNGYWSTTAANLGRGQPIQVQANVRGIDPKRTDVVTVNTPVVRRPDIAVTSLNGASTAPPNTQVMFQAMVSELNGDVGARADCVLSVNGTDVDHADGIWVDASGTVSCLFSHSFDTPGTYDVRVTASNVVPGDWDTSNNSASTSITIAPSHGTIDHGYLTVSEAHYGYFYQSSSTQPDVTYERQLHYDYSYSQIYGYGYSSQIATHPMQRLDLSIAVDGSNVLTESLAPAYSGVYDDGFSFRQGYTQFYGNGRWATAYSYDYYGAYPAYSYFDVQILRGSVTYLGHDQYCYAWGCNTWVYNYTDFWDGGGTFGFTANSVVNFQADFVGADGEHNGFKETFDPLVRQDFGPWNDYYYCYSFGSYSSCYGQTDWHGYYVYSNKYW